MLVRIENKTIILHSATSLVTNSSTSVFSEATQTTIKELRAVIDGLLELAGASLTADDLFIFALVNTSNEDCNLDRIEKEYKVNYRNANVIYNKIIDSLEFPTWWDDCDTCNSEYSNIELHVKAKSDANSKLAKHITAFLYSLEIDAETDG